MDFLLTILASVKLLGIPSAPVKRICLLAVNFIRSSGCVYVQDKVIVPFLFLFSP